jgi:hypothetical protein
MLLFQKNGGECKNHKKTRKNMKHEHETKVTGGGTWKKRYTT